MYNVIPILKDNIVSNFLEGFKSLETQRAYTTDIKKFFNVSDTRKITNYKIKDVDYKQIQDYIIKADNDGMSKSTIKRRIASLQSFYNYCFYEGIVSNNPFIDPRIGRLLKNYLDQNEEFIGRALSIKEIKELTSRIRLKNKRDYMLINTMLKTGIRRNEAISINCNDIIYNNIKEKWYLQVRGKGRKIRYIQITDSLYNELKEWNQNIGVSEERIFPMSKSNVNKRLSIYTDISVHDLRRTFATNLIKNGIEIVKLQYILGHSDIKTTMKYVKEIENFDQNIDDYITW